jgi:hypothetical protein
VEKEHLLSTVRGIFLSFSVKQLGSSEHLREMHGVGGGANVDFDIAEM